MFPFIKTTFFQAMLDGFSNGVVIFNTDGKVYAVNSAAAAILGYPEERCTAMTWEELFAGVALKDELKEFVRHAMDASSPKAFPFNTRYTRPSGEYRNLTLTKSVLADYGKTFGILVEVTDVTHIYAMHEREKRIMEEKSLVQRERAESLRKLSMAVAHQIRNPLTMIGGFAGLLMKHTPPEARECEYIRSILSGGYRLEEIVTAVSEFTALNVDKRCPVRVSQIVDSARKLAEAATPQSSEKAVWNLCVNGLKVSADFDLMVKAVAEVFKNSLESLDEANGGSISVSTRCDNGRPVLEVSDTGRGIDENIRPFIFDPFSTTKPVGVGMGLTKAERIILEHGGNITITSEPGKGTTVDIEMDRG